MLRRMLLCFVAAASAAVAPEVAGARVFKLGHVFQPTHAMHLAAVKAAEHFASCTQGRHSFDVYPASQLGSDNAMMQQQRIGGVDVTLTSFIFASTSYPPLAIGAAPFIFRDKDHAIAYMNSDLFRQAWRGWEKATGQHILSSAYFGVYNVSSNRPVEKPEDMRGLKVRVPDTPIFMAFPRALGAAPTPIPLHEVYLALQQGVAEASINGLHMTHAGKFYEVQKFINPTHHMVDFTLWVTGDIMWRALSEADRACLQQAADVFGKEATARILVEEDTLRDRMVAEGYVKFTNVDKAAFQAAVGGAVEKFAKDFGVDMALVEQIRNLGR